MNPFKRSPKEKAAPEFVSEEELDESDSLTIQLRVSDPELIWLIRSRPEGEAREEFLNRALRIGILTLESAIGRVDADLVGNATNQLLEKLSGSLDDYFDPTDGKFNRRVEGLIEKDGELERMLKEKVGAENSELSRTLEGFIGENSPLLKMLGEDESQGFLKAIAEAVESRLRDQRERILREFSLDHKESALSRLVSEMENSQNDIITQFSLDDEESALSRMKKVLVDLFKEEKEEGRVFREEVLEKLSAIDARRKQSDRSTTHGLDFEDSLLAIVGELADRAGDVFDRTGNSVGHIKHCKIGDGVITLGAEQAATGERIVIEAKENAQYSLPKALEEMDKARKNREARVGLFVFSRKTAPSGIAPMRRHGNDVAVVWDSGDPSTDVYLEAGISVAKAICCRQAADRKNSKSDFRAIDGAIREIERNATGLDEIGTLVGTVRNNAEKIENRVRIMKDAITKQIEVLDEHMEDLRAITEFREDVVG